MIHILSQGVYLIKMIKKNKCVKCLKEYNELDGQFTLHQSKEICNDCYLKENITDSNSRSELRIKNAILNKHKSKTRLSRELKIDYYKVDSTIDKMERNGLVEVYTSRKGFKFYKFK